MPWCVGFVLNTVLTLLIFLLFFSIPGFWTHNQGGQIFFVENRPKMVKIRTFCRTRSPIWAKNRTLLWGVCTSGQPWSDQGGSKKVRSLHAESNSTSKDTIIFKRGSNIWYSSFLQPNFCQFQRVIVWLVFRFQEGGTHFPSQCGQLCLVCFVRKFDL